MSQVPNDPELGPIETALGSLTPARSRIDRDRVMFQAGVLHAKAESRRRWVWPSIAATLAVVVLSESVALAVRPGPRVMVVQQPAPQPESRPGAPEPVQILSQTLPTRSEGNRALGSRRRGDTCYQAAGAPLRGRRASKSSSAFFLSRMAAPESPSPLRRYEFNKVFNLGGPS